MKLNKLGVSKREKFVLVSIILTVILLLTQLVDIQWRYLTILFFSLLTVAFSIYALWQDIKGIEWFMLFALPTLFSAGVSLFYFLLPVRWLTRLPFALIYGVSFYAILLSENIFNVASIRTIQLYQAALAVSSFLSILTFFLYSNIILSFHLPSWQNFILFYLLSVIFLLINLWNVTLESYLEKSLVRISAVMALIIAQTIFILSFWPVPPLVGALFITTVFYLLIGMCQTNLAKKPLGNLNWEYNLFLFVLLVLLWRSRWGG